MSRAVHAKSSTRGGGGPADGKRAASAPARSPEAGPGRLQRKCAACAQDDEIGRVQRKCAACAQDDEIGRAQRKCAACAQQDERLARRADRGAAASPLTAPPVVHDVLRATGQPLDHDTRAFMEARFAHDFRSVRVHTDARAETAARAVGALGFTVGDHVVFGAGKYAPRDSGGRALLAHELAHVVQQRTSPARTPAAKGLPITSAGDPEEAQADAAARQAMSGQAVSVLGSPGVLGGARLARQPAGPAPANPCAQSPTSTAVTNVRENIVRDFLPNPANAGVCLVHLHRNEQNAFRSGQSIRQRFCANFVHLSGSGRMIHVTVPSGPRRRDRGGRCAVDPNRIFTGPGITAQVRDHGCPRPTEANAILTGYSTELWLAIEECRRGANGPLPIVALHNNDPGPPTTPTDLADTQSVDVPHPGASGRTTEGVDDFYLATQQADYDVLRTGSGTVGGRAVTLSGAHNAALQVRTPATDDGSLSVALGLRGAATAPAERYINIETLHRRRDDVAIRLAEDAATLLGVQPCSTGCPPPGAAPQAGGVLQRQEDPRPTTETSETTEADFSGAAPQVGGVLQRQEDPRPTTETTQTTETTEEDFSGAEEEPESWIDLILRLLRELIRLLRSYGNRPPAGTREAVPPSRTSCLTFADAAAMDTRKAHWAGVLAATPLADVVAWIVGSGSGAPFTTARAESEQQKNCMLNALRASARTAGSPLRLPAGNNAAWTASGFRSFADQARIWNRKFAFTGAPFDRITQEARDVCGSGLAPGDVQWNPGNPSHAACWASLSPEQRSREILQASSAPGISRHHWGSDFDLFSTEPSHFEAGARFADEYSWLQANALTYGFIQSFTTLSSFMRIGYMEERWHWSYYPVAQALVEFASAHTADIRTALRTAWGSAPQFAYIRQHWRQFMFNVHQRPTAPP